MPVKLSLGLENSLLGEFGLSSMMNYGVIEIYSGDQPEQADFSPTGTLLARITQNGVPFEVGTNRGGCQLQLMGTGGLGFVPGWRLKGITNGIAGYWRWKWNAPDDDSDTLFFPRIDGLVGESLVLRSNNITPESDILISDFLIVFSTCTRS
jgi:hypothetical protein|tara:strand:- start:1474 stop:1929 length:456 start_codon:yes stop_codon:yes gene_type:complete